MNHDDLEEFQKALEQAKKEENTNQDEIDDDFGFREVLIERQKHKDALKERLIKQNFSDKEIDKLFKIIKKAEDDMEKVKKSLKYDSKMPGLGVKLKRDLIEIQNKMKADFNKEFMEMLEKKKNK